MKNPHWVDLNNPQAVIAALRNIPPLDHAEVKSLRNEEERDPQDFQVQKIPGEEYYQTWCERDGASLKEELADVLLRLQIIHYLLFLRDIHDHDVVPF